MDSQDAYNRLEQAIKHGLQIQEKKEKRKKLQEQKYEEYLTELKNKKRNLAKMWLETFDHIANTLTPISNRIGMCYSGNTAKVWLFDQPSERNYFGDREPEVRTVFGDKLDQRSITLTKAANGEILIPYLQGPDKIPFYSPEGQRVLVEYFADIVEKDHASRCLKSEDAAHKILLAGQARVLKDWLKESALLVTLINVPILISLDYLPQALHGLIMGIAMAEIGIGLVLTTVLGVIRISLNREPYQ